MFTVNFKGKPNPKDKNLVKLEMVLFKTGYNRVTKTINITGPYKYWDQTQQNFNHTSADCLNTNKHLLDLKLKYLKVAEEWETEGKDWSPIQWSHCFKSNKREKDKVKVITVYKMIEQIIEKTKEKQRLKNGQVVTSRGTGKYYLALKNHLLIFTKEKYGKAFTTYHFEDITEEFISDFIFYLKVNAIKKNHKGGIDCYLRKFYGVFYYAGKENVPYADKSIFESFRLEMRHKQYEPRTIPLEVMSQIENIDRSLLSKKEDFWLDLFLFSFYAGGMANIDVCYLTWDCIQDDVITYERMKTPKQASLPFINKAKAIVKKHQDKCYGNYVLPVFSGKHNEEWQKRARVMRLSLKVNATLKKVASIIGYKDKITWYSARGTFITKLVDEGYNAFEVANMAGNSILTIHKNYFKQTKMGNVSQNLNNIF